MQGQRIRQEYAAPQLDSLDYWLQTQLTRISGKSALADAIRYGLARLQRLRPFLDDGRLSIDNNPAERGIPHILALTVRSHCRYVKRWFQAAVASISGIPLKISNKIDGGHLLLIIYRPIIYERSWYSWAGPCSQPNVDAENHVPAA